MFRVFLPQQLRERWIGQYSDLVSFIMVSIAGACVAQVRGDAFARQQ